MKINAAADLSDLWVRHDNWRLYEAYVVGTLKRAHPGLRVRPNVRRKGRKSGLLRQIDILVETPQITIALDCKCYRRKVDVKHVEAFLGMLADLGISLGILVTKVGYTKGALARARNDRRKISLEILSPDRLSKSQHIGAPLIWRGSLGIFLTCPDGWIVDTEKYDEGICNWLIAFYPLGFTLNSAVRHASFIYADIFLSNDRTLENFADMHEDNIRKDDPSASIERSATRIADERSVSRPALFRRARKGPDSFGSEYTLYVDYGKHVLMLVLLTTPESEADDSLIFELARKTFTMQVNDKRR